MSRFPMRAAFPPSSPSMKKEEYVALLDRSDSESPIDEEEFSRLQESLTQRKAGSLRLITSFLCAFILFDAIVYAYVGHALFRGEAMPKLELKNPYVGLDEMYGYGIVNSSYHAPIVNKARRVVHVFSDDPHRGSPVDEHRSLTSYGMLSPPEQHLRVSPEIHTILQFRIIDYGMEDCQLSLNLPSLDASLSDPYVFHAESETTLLDVCELDVAELLDVPKVTWANRPPCTKSVGSLIAIPGSETFLPRFPCKWGTLHTFEVSCSSHSPQCGVDVWANQTVHWGIQLLQHQTV